MGCRSASTGYLNGETMNAAIFREYDIRGIAEKDLTDPVVRHLGRAFGTYLLRREHSEIVLGRDCRLSSNRLRDRLVEGLIHAGLRIVDVGVCPTPVLYFARQKLQSQGAVMITGSHNPADYNGFKMLAGSSTLYGEEIQKLYKLCRKQDFEVGSGTLQERPILKQYIEYLQHSLGRLERPSKIVVDCGNGTASLVAPAVYRNLGCQVVELFCDMDGRFPNHHPDPTVVSNLQDLIRAVRQEEAAVGLAFDGDGDRIGAVDDRGRIVWGDQLMVLYSRDILRQEPGATIIADVKCSQILYDEIENLGGRGIMYRTGHSLIKAKMKKEKALLAGEMSGHMFFADRYFGYDDATYAGARLLEILSHSDDQISDLLADLPQTHHTPEIRVDCPEEHKFELVSLAQDYFRRHYRTVTVDGVRVLFEDGWGLIRASNTQPALVLRFEARSAERLEQIRDLMEGKLEELKKTVEKDA